MHYLVITNSLTTAIIHAIEKGHNFQKIEDLLKLLVTKISTHKQVQEPRFLNYALEVATKADNPHVIGVLVQYGAMIIESCIGVAKANERHDALTMLLLLLAAHTGNINKSVLRKVCEKQNSMFDFQMDHYMCSMAAPLQIAHCSGHTDVRDKLLFVLGVYYTSGCVYWHGLQLQRLEIKWLRKITWVKDLILSKNRLKTLPVQMETYLQQV